MDIVFIHSNYPAQFRNLAATIGANKENRVVFLTERKDAIKDRIKGVDVEIFTPHRKPNENTHHYLHATEESVLKGQAVLRSLSELVGQGLKPKVVITHGGMGLGLFIKDLLPSSVHIGYFEWYFRPETAIHLIENFELNAQLKAGLRNIPILKELESCDAAVTPTQWQKKQFPTEYHNKLSVIFDGIDTNFFKPCVDSEKHKSINHKIYNRETGEEFILKERSKIVSYATRGMEPLRGFPEFMRSLPLILEKNNDAEIIIAGADRRAYSYDAPSESGSWKEYMLKELKGTCNLDRIYFCGLLNYQDYRTLLWRSDTHCYLTRPYVTSWSLFEAVACEAVMAVNKSEATENIAEEDSVQWVDIENTESISNKINENLATVPSKRSKIKDGYSFNESVTSWANLINRLVNR